MRQVDAHEKAEAAREAADLIDPVKIAQRAAHEALPSWMKRRE
jgi:hypothetical protein